MRLLGKLKSIFSKVSEIGEDLSSLYDKAKEGGGQSYE